ncbi:MAG TPA: helix-turn-helix domain-containing protein [Jiangellaceae bacterium]
MTTTTLATIPEPLWAVEDVAAYLGIPTKTIYEWRCKDYGPKGFRVGRYVRYRREDVEAWLDSITGSQA